MLSIVVPAEVTRCRPISFLNSTTAMQSKHRVGRGLEPNHWSELQKLCVYRGPKRVRLVSNLPWRKRKRREEKRRREEKKSFKKIRQKARHNQSNWLDIDLTKWFVAFWKGSNIWTRSIEPIFLAIGLCKVCAEGRNQRRKKEEEKKKEKYIHWGVWYIYIYMKRSTNEVGVVTQNIQKE